MVCMHRSARLSLCDQEPDLKTLGSKLDILMPCHKTSDRFPRLSEGQECPQSVAGHSPWRWSGSTSHNNRLDVPFARHELAVLTSVDRGILDSQG